MQVFIKKRFGAGIGILTIWGKIVIGIVVPD